MVALFTNNLSEEGSQQAAYDLLKRGEEMGMDVTPRLLNPRSIPVINANRAGGDSNDMQSWVNSAIQQSKALVENFCPGVTSEE